MAKRKVPANWMATRKEHTSYNMFWLGQNLLWGFAGYISTYLTDAGLDALIAGVVLLVPKIWDAVNDVIFGFIIDRVNFKKGKFLPWVRIGVTFVGIVTILLFSIPSGFPSWAKIVWFLLFYLLFDGLYTILDAPAFALSTVMTSDLQEKTEFIAGNKLWAMVGGTLAFLVIMLLENKLSWTVIGIILCGVGTLLMIPILFTAKERVKAEPQEKEEKFTFKQMFNYLKTNKYLFVVLIAFLMFGLTAVEQIMAIYLVRYCFPDLTIFGTIMAAVVSVSVIIYSIVVPNLTKKFDKFYILLGALAISTVVSIICMFVGFSSPVLACIFVALKCVGLAGWQIVIYMLVADCVEYGQFKSGTRAAGITFSLQTFISKLKGALVNSFMLFALAIIGFDLKPQPADLGQRIWDLYIILPVIGYVIGGVLLLLFYKLRDKYVAAMTKYNNGEISYDACMKVLDDKFGEPAIIKE